MEEFTLAKKDYASLSLTLGVCIQLLNHLTNEDSDIIAREVSNIAFSQMEENPGLVDEVIDRYTKANKGITTQPILLARRNPPDEAA
jgi:hypothetical protein